VKTGEPKGKPEQSSGAQDRMRVGCAFYFETEGIWAERSIAGKSVTTEVDGVAIRLDLPDSPQAFSYPYATASAVSPSGSERREQRDAGDDRPPPALEDSGGPCISIRVVRVVANVDAPARLRAGQSSPEARTSYDVARNRMRQAAQLALRRLEEWIRVDKEQVWLPPPAVEEIQIGSEEMVDLERSESLGVKTFSGGRLLVLPKGTELSTEDLARLPGLLKEDPPLWARVLADAQYYTWTDEWAAPERAVLFAALACELAVKETLRETAEGEVRALLELVLEHPRDYSLAAAELFAKPMQAITGRSLRDEDRALWKRVDVLFRERNRVAHKGARLSHREARELVASAVEAIEWLRRVSG
jgi:hypothetical protein